MLAKNQPVETRPTPFTLLIHRLSNLPKVWPQVYWGEKLRERLLRLKQFNLFALWLRPIFSQALILTIVALSSFGALGQQLKPALAAEIGHLEIETGPVWLRKAEKEKFTPVENGAVVRVGDSIRVGGSAKLKFNAENEIKLAATTEIEIIEPDKTNTKVALVTGMVETNVEDQNQLEVATLQGSITTSSADFALKVDQKTGLTEVRTESQQTKFVTAAPTATTPVPAEPETPALALPEIAQLELRLDFMQIQLFDALKKAQAKQAATAEKIANLTKKQKAELLTELKLETSVGNPNTTLTLFLREKYPASPELLRALNYLAKIKNLEDILSYYLVPEPRFLQAKPEFELLPKNYQPAPPFEIIFLASKSLELAHSEVHPASREIISLVVQDLQAKLATGKLTVAEILSELNQPIYLQAVTELAKLNPAVFTERLQELQTQIQQFKGF